MACTSLAAVTRACGAAGITGGLQKLYIIAYTDLDAATGAVAGEYFTESAGVVNDIGLDTGKTFVEIGLLPNSAGIVEALTKNVQNGTSFFTQTLTLPLANITTENRNFVLSVLNQDVAVIAKSASGQWTVLGLSGGFALSGSDGGLGVAPGDDVGYKLTFSGIDSAPMRLVDPTIITGLLPA